MDLSAAVNDAVNVIKFQKEKNIYDGAKIGRVVRNFPGEEFNRLSGYEINDVVLYEEEGFSGTLRVGKTYQTDSPNSKGNTYRINIGVPRECIEEIRI